MCAAVPFKGVLIRDLESDQVGAFLAFYSRSFADRPNLAALFQHQFQNPCNHHRSLPPVALAVDEENIIGQFPVQPCKYVCNGQTRPAYIGYDFYVAEQYRQTGSGALLACHVVRRFHPYFVIGLSDTAKRMMSALKLRVIGELHKYLWLRKSMTTAASILRALTGAPAATLPDRPFPGIVPCRGKRLSQSFNPLDGDAVENNDKVLAFSRNAEFMRWRFLDHPNRYNLFTFAPRSSTYFVVRMCEWRGLRVLSLIDYRYPTSCPYLLKDIVEASKAVAKIVRADGVLTMSSYAPVDRVLSESAFFRVGKPNLIMADPDVTPDPELISAREAVLVTMADGDTDLLFQEAAC